MLEREIASVVYNSVNAVDVTMVRLQLHEKPKKLRGVLQEEIDAILLGFGLCSETVTVIFKNVPLLKPQIVPIHIKGKLL